MSRPQSLLFVCRGNTCRSPMAAAMARQWWPGCKIQSAGISVHLEGQGAAQQAVAAMRRRGIDISDHKTTSIGKVDVESFEYIVAMDRAVLQVLHEKDIDLARVQEAYVDDPFNGDARQYEDCALAIERKLCALTF